MNTIASLKRIFPKNNAVWAVVGKIKYTNVNGCVQWRLNYL